MSRGLISDADADLRSALPVSGQVPGLFLDDPLYVAFCAAIDDVLVPALVAVDCFAAYLDPRLAPTDYLPWLAGLVGSSAESAAIALAVSTHADRGTPRGLRASVAARAEVPETAVSVVEAGGVTWSSEPRPRIAGAVTSAPGVQVQVRVTIGPERDPARLLDELRSLVASEIPAHCSCDVEVVQ